MRSIVNLIIYWKVTAGLLFQGEQFCACAHRKEHNLPSGRAFF